MELTLSAAAQATGKGKSTLLRAVKSGKLSARRTDDGTFMVDASELARVFTMKRMERVMTHHEAVSDAPRSGAEPADVPDAEKAVLQVKVTMLENQLARERETVEDLKKRLDDEQQERRNLQRQLMPPAQAQAAKPVGFLGRLLGRS